jgi:hypothetical protein
MDDCLFLIGAHLYARRTDGDVRRRPRVERVSGRRKGLMGASEGLTTSGVSGSYTGSGRWIRLRIPGLLSNV